MCPVNTYINSQEPGEVLTVNALYEWTLHFRRRNINFSRDKLKPIFGYQTSA